MAGALVLLKSRARNVQDFSNLEKVANSSAASWGVQVESIGMSMKFCTSKRLHFRLPENEEVTIPINGSDVALPAWSTYKYFLLLFLQTNKLRISFEETSNVSGTGFYSELDFHSSQQS